MDQNLWKALYNANKDAGYPVATLIFHDVGPYHLETSPLICRANQWTDFYMIRTSVMKELSERSSTPYKRIQKIKRLNSLINWLNIRSEFGTDPL